ncbi:Zinc finger CCHC domain-containing protein 8 [Balamuthia mandrillaris]
MERAAPLLPGVADGERRTSSGVEEGVQQAALARLQQQNMRLRKEVRQLRRQLASYAQRVPPKHMLHDTLCSITFYHMNEADIRRVQSVVESCSYEPRGANAPLYVDESASNRKAISSNRIREAGEEHEEVEEEEEEEEQTTTRSFKTHHKNQETKDEAEEEDEEEEVEEEQESRYPPFTTHFLRRDLGFQIQKGGFSDASLWLDSVPDYERGYDEPLSLEPIRNDNELPLKEEPRCFNCDKPGHTLSECPLPKNRVAISVNRMAYQAQNTRAERYASNQRLGFSSKFAPGILSDELKAALGMEEGELPPYYSHMQRHGYPPGYIGYKQDEEQTESDRTTHRRKRKKLEEPPEEMISLVQSASSSSTTGRPVKLVEYPGLQNCPLPMLFQDHRQNSVQSTPSYSMHPLPPPQSRPPPPPARASSAHTQQQQVSSAYSAPVKTRLENDEDMDLEEDDLDLSQFQHESVNKEQTSLSPPPPPLPKDEEEQERLAEEEEEEQERLAEKEELERKRQRQVERALRWRQMRSFLLAQEEEEQQQLLAQIQQERQRQQEQKEEEEELDQNAIYSDN